MGFLWDAAFLEATFEILRSANSNTRVLLRMLKPRPHGVTEFPDENTQNINKIKDKGI